MKAQVRVSSQLNVEAWQEHLIDYWDKQLPPLICHGFPLNFDTNIRLSSTLKNHSSATQF